MTAPPAVVAADELMHAIDPDDWSWNESWFLSWIDLNGGPAGFFRVGVLPNQRRAIFWGFVYVDGEWLGVEESRLAAEDLDVATGVAYDRWALQFAWRPDPPLESARFAFAADAMVRSGADAGRYRQVTLELVCTGTAACVPTGTGDDDRESPYPASRFEQMLTAAGSIVVDGRRQEIRAGAHRDRSWGPREWRQAFTLGDLQAPGRQLYFVGRTFPGLGMAFLREEDRVQHLLVTDGAIAFDDAAGTARTARLELGGPSDPIEVVMRPIAPSVMFDMAHTCPEPERWLYWRTLVEAEVTGWDAPCRGWLETSRYGA